MSKYDPLKHFLQSRPNDETAMTFSDVERVLGFPLPDSARNWAAWWSNNTGTHVGVRAWRDVGFRTARVDLRGERVTFVREIGVREIGVQETGAVREASSSFAHRPAEGVDSAALHIPLQNLSRSTLRMVDDWMEESGSDRAGAVAALLNAAAMARRRALLETLPVARMPAGHDSTAMIREDRDAR